MMAAVESTMLNCLEYRENKIDICVHGTYHARTPTILSPRKPSTVPKSEITGELSTDQARVPTKLRVSEPEA